MHTFEFTFVVDGVDHHVDGFEDAFFEAGCDDATLAVMHGAVVVNFSREADTYKDAVLSAFEDILKSGASMKRFEPDFLVSSVEIANRAGVTRQAIALYASGERGENFPAPTARITTRSPLWDWVEVSRWLVGNGKLKHGVYRRAQISRVINLGAARNCGLAEARHAIDAALSEPI